MGVKVPGSLEGERRQCRRQGWTATGGMAGMQAVACGADQHRGQDRHEAGVAGCPNGSCSRGAESGFLCESCTRSSGRCDMCCDTGGEADPLLSWSTPPPPCHNTVEPGRMALSLLRDGRAATPTPREEGNDASQEGRQSSPDSNAPRRYTAASGGTESNLRGADGV